MTENAKRASWLRIDNIVNPAPAIAAMWEESQERLSYVREFLKLPFEPERLALFQGYVNRLMRSDDCLLPGCERELIALVVSLENRCEACIITHAGALQAHGMEKRTVDVLLANWRRADLSERERALAVFASNLTVHPDNASEGDLDKLSRAEGTRPRMIGRSRNTIGKLPAALSEDGRDGTRDVGDRGEPTPRRSDQRGAG